MLNFVQVAWLGLARAQLCTDTMRQLVQQRTCGTRSSSYSTLYRYAAAARTEIHRRDETSSSVGNTLQQLVQQSTGGTRHPPVCCPATARTRGQQCQKRTSPHYHHYTHYPTPPCNPYTHYSTHPRIIPCRPYSTPLLTTVQLLLAIAS